MRAKFQSMWIFCSRVFQTVWQKNSWKNVVSEPSRASSSRITFMWSKRNVFFCAKNRTIRIINYRYIMLLRALDCELTQHKTSPAYELVIIGWVVHGSFELCTKQSNNCKNLAKPPWKTAPKWMFLYKLLESVKHAWVRSAYAHETYCYSIYHLLKQLENIS